MLDPDGNTEARFSIETSHMESNNCLFYFQVIYQSAIVFFLSRFFFIDSGLATRQSFDNKSE